MESKNAFIAILLSLAILLGYQYFFPPPKPLDPVATTAPGTATLPAAKSETQPAPAVSAVVAATPEPGAAPTVARPGRDILVETSLYTAILQESGGGVKSFKLKKYRESLADNSPAKELVATEASFELPLYFTWGAAMAGQVPYLAADRDKVATRAAGEETLHLRGTTATGLEISRTLVFKDDGYAIQLEVEVHNISGQPLQGAPSLQLTNRPFTKGLDKQAVFHGPAAYGNKQLTEIKSDDLKAGAQSLTGQFDWVAYEDTYFMCGIMPKDTGVNTLNFSLADTDKVTTKLSAEPVTLPADGRLKYRYTVYFGPKEMASLQKVGNNLDKVINFGWFDIMAKPVLRLLNFLYTYLHNYGWAIIFVTVLIKLAFWPISHKGMKSMKTMQKIQPKLAKLREKYKDDQARLNTEMIALYKTYKVNPVGGCLPMILQIPVFFALYKVLLQTIELRHAPFMWWITDLAAPDRLAIGIDIPYLGGIPVLTLLMGGSMFLQQKMTPSSADPAQAKVMMFLPVVFTFMFINFASGLVLYWFVNNLLSITQQYVINRQTAE